MLYPNIRVSLFSISLALAWFCPGSRSLGQSPAAGLEFDSLQRTHYARFGETNIHFTFTVTNRSAANIVVQGVTTSCGCTVGELPPLPWTLKPGEGGVIGFNMDIIGKEGEVNKTGTIQTSTGETTLQLHVQIPEMEGSMRDINQQLAAANRQIVFQGQCAECHATPTVGKTGKALFDAACGICHVSEERASFVPELHKFLGSSSSFWNSRTSFGIEGTLMPAFAKSRGGPLDDAQIQSLVNYLVNDLKNEPIVENTVRVRVTSINPAPNSTIDTLYQGSEIIFENRETSLDPASILFEINGARALVFTAPLTKGFSLSAPGFAQIPSGSTVRARLSFKDNQGFPQLHEWSFVVNYPFLPASTRVDATGQTRGFKIRTVHATAPASNRLAWAIDALKPGSTTTRDYDQTTTADVINFSHSAVAGNPHGHFDGDQSFPGAQAPRDTNGWILEATGHVQLPAGTTRFGFNTAGSYQLSIGPLRDGSTVLAGSTDGVGGDVFRDVVVEQAGLYPVRLVWCQAPDSGALEWFTINKSGPPRTLVNGSDGYVAYREVVTSGPTVQLLSAAQVTGPYAAEASAVLDVSRHEISVKPSGTSRFYRLSGGVRPDSIRLNVDGSLVLIHYP